MSVVALPRGLEWWRKEPGGAEWLERLSGIVVECVSAWELELGAAFEPATIAFVAPVRLADGADAVLKVNFPDPESEHEADALQYWEGKGTVTLLAHDAERRALLVERCEPGDQLWSPGAHALAWGTSEDGGSDEMVACARWLAEA